MQQFLKLKLNQINFKLSEFFVSLCLNFCKICQMLQPEYGKNKPVVLNDKPQTQTCECEVTSGCTSVVG